MNITVQILNKELKCIVMTFIFTQLFLNHIVSIVQKACFYTSFEQYFFKPYLLITKMHYNTLLYCLFSNAQTIEMFRFLFEASIDNNKIINE